MPSIVIFLIRFVFGAIIGSFLNVVGLRYRSGLTLGGRSACASCARTLKWYELVPIWSYFALRGRCSTCKVRISWLYPGMEILTGLIFATVLPGYWPAFAIYVVIFIYDLRHKIIPDSLVYASIGYALVVRLLFFHSSLADWLAGPVLFALFALGWLLSRGRALGFGDAKLALSIGLLLGASMGLSAIVLSFWIGTAITLPVMFFSMFFSQKKLTMKSEIPFAPFIILGAWGSLLFHLDLFHLTSF
ncbi:prepilin peptidase [Candidatus Parcubacteria bacterium]|nr:prepilin peptidase [Candidatus Parcubacteria bacterium]